MRKRTFAPRLARRIMLLAGFKHYGNYSALSGQITMIKIDLTSEVNQTHQALIDTYDIKGVPIIIFIDAQGAERRELRLVDYMSAENYLKRM